MRSCCVSGRTGRFLRLICLGLLVVGSRIGSAQEGAGEGEAGSVRADRSELATQATRPPGENVSEAIENHLANYLHFALIGQFDIADSHAEALLKLPALRPLSPDAAEALVTLTDEDHYKDAIDILLLLINNTSIADNARKVLDLIREAHRTQSRNPERILDSIRMLAGTPTQRMTALERLRDAGEYAVPWLLRVIADLRQKELHPFVMAVLPQLGKGILNPLVQALRIEDPVIVRYVAQALGKMGYPQALPYLKQVATDPRSNPDVRAAATESIEKILALHPGALDLPAPDLFADLAEKYYADIDALRADPRFPEANVWYAVDRTIKPVAVPRRIFSLVMCMRCCEQALELAADQPEVVALWLAANFRREAALGLDVESEKVVETADATRPPHFPRGVYFARVAGPTQCMKVLGRGLEERDRNIALGAIAALEGTIGPSAISGQAEEGVLSLGRALVFPDLMVRIKAALALAHAMPTRPFEGADQVIPVLAATLTLTDGKYYLVVDPDEQAGRAIAEGLARQGAEVITATRFADAMRRVRKERTHLDGIFLSARISQPSPVQAMRLLVEDDRFGLTPVVFYAGADQPFDEGRLSDIAKPAWRLLRLAKGQQPGADLAEALLIKLQDAAKQMGAARLDEQTAQALALEAARVLRDLAVHGHTVFDPGQATPALTQVLSSPSEELRAAALRVLGRLNRQDAQQAVAAVALSERQSESLRKVAFVALAESARQFGSYLDDATIRRLKVTAFEGENLSLRAFASRAIGALNLPERQAVGVILDNRSIGAAP